MVSRSSLSPICNRDNAQHNGQTNFQSWHSTHVTLASEPSSHCCSTEPSTHVVTLTRHAASEHTRNGERFFLPNSVAVLVQVEFTYIRYCRCAWAPVCGVWIKLFGQSLLGVRAFTRIFLLSVSTIKFPACVSAQKKNQGWRMVATKEAWMPSAGLAVRVPPFGRKRTVGDSAAHLRKGKMDVQPL